jgi:hypothetical protein
MLDLIKKLRIRPLELKQASTTPNGLLQKGRAGMKRDRARFAPLCLGLPGTTANHRLSSSPSWGCHLAGGFTMRTARVKSLVNCSPVFRNFRFSVICVGQTWKLPGFKDPAKEIPTPPSECTPLRATVASPPTRPFFLRRGGNLE